MKNWLPVIIAAFLFTAGILALGYISFGLLQANLRRFRIKNPATLHHEVFF